MQKGHGAADKLLADDVDLEFIDRVVADGGEAGEEDATDATRMLLANNFLGPKRFGKMFLDLKPFRPPRKALEALGLAMKKAVPEDPALKNSTIPAGFTYLGQFIDHDVTRDDTKKFPRPGRCSAPASRYR